MKTVARAMQMYDDEVTRRSGIVALDGARYGSGRQAVVRVPCHIVTGIREMQLFWKCVPNGVVVETVAERE